MAGPLDFRRISLERRVHPPGAHFDPGIARTRMRAKSLKTRAFFRTGKTASPDRVVVPILL
jgi:hypothetical protein